MKRAPLRRKTPLRTSAVPNPPRKRKLTVERLETRQKQRCRIRDDAQCQAHARALGVAKAAKPGSDEWVAAEEVLALRCRGQIEVHHIHPKGLGGRTNPYIHDLSNLVCACTGHHIWAHANPAKATFVALYRRTLELA